MLRTMITKHSIQMMQCWQWNKIYSFSPPSALPPFNKERFQREIQRQQNFGITQTMYHLSSKWNAANCKKKDTHFHRGIKRGCHILEWREKCFRGVWSKCCTETNVLIWPTYWMHAAYYIHLHNGMFHQILIKKLKTFLYRDSYTNYIYLD